MEFKWKDGQWSSSGKMLQCDGVLVQVLGVDLSSACHLALAKVKGEELNQKVLFLGFLHDQLPHPSVHSRLRLGGQRGVCW